MELSAIREAVRQQPFVPFRLKMADGSDVLVRHPEMIAIPEAGRRVVVFNEYDALTILDPLLIVSINFPATQQSSTNDPSQN